MLLKTYKLIFFSCVWAWLSACSGEAKDALVTNTSTVTPTPLQDTVSNDNQPTQEVFSATPRLLAIDNDNLSIRTNNTNWNLALAGRGNFYTATTQYLIFNDEKVVLEIMIDGHGDPAEFDIDVKVNYFSEDEDKSLAAWANNQYSDGLLINAAEAPLHVYSLVTDVFSVINANYIPTEDIGYRHYMVEYFVNNYADNYVSIASFSSQMTVVIPEQE